MTIHEPVMTTEILGFLMPERGGLFVDCTVGTGGHARALLDAGATRVVALDRDRDTLAIAGQELAAWRERVTFVHADYREIEAVLDAQAIDFVDGVLADLGMSSYQLETGERGFSFRHDAPLDMRMDRSKGPTAAELLRDVTEPALAEVITRFGEERHARRIARAVVDARRRAPLETTGQLAAVVRRVVPRGGARIDPATRTFQAIRIWVNEELEGLETFVAAVVRRLRAGARFVVLTFHSLEDRLIKHALRDLARQRDAVVRLLTKHPIRPGAAEVARNPRSRSAKLRVAERLA
jgi:16S rRNA (cytosine1402-N4)-methyltransferase